MAREISLTTPVIFAWIIVEGIIRAVGTVAAGICIAVGMVIAIGMVMLLHSSLRGDAER